MADETGRWFDDARSSHRDKHGARINRPKNLIHVIGHFAEPTDVRTNPAAACAPGNLRRRFISVGVIEGRAPASVAAAFEKFAVHVDNAARSGLLVEVVHVLRAEKKPLSQCTFELGERDMTGIGFGVRSDTASHGVELPDEPRIAVPGVRRRDLFKAIIPPQAARAAKRGNAAFGADSRTGENEHAIFG